MGLATAAIVGGGLLAARSAKRSADKQVQSVNDAAGVQERQYQQTRADFEPWRDAGRRALSRLDHASKGDFRHFEQSPGYDFVRREGMRDVGNSFSAIGSQLSGNALRALSRYNQGLASQEYGNWWNRQAGLAGVGQAATESTGYAGQNASSNVSNALMQGGNARASGIAGVNDALQGTIQNYMTYNALQPSGAAKMMPRPDWRSNINWLKT